MIVTSDISPDKLLAGIFTFVFIRVCPVIYYLSCVCMCVCHFQPLSLDFALVNKSHCVLSPLLVIFFYVVGKCTKKLTISLHEKDSTH